MSGHEAPPPAATPSADVATAPAPAAHKSPASETAVRRGRLWLRRHAAAIAAATAAMALATVVAALVLELGEARLSLPWSYVGEGDNKFYLLLFKGILAHGSYQANPNLGAPFGMQLYDFPQGGDNLNLLLVRALGVFSHNPALVLNLFFLLTFPLAALSSFAALRALGVSVGMALAGATIFALLPYHFYRGESQVLLSAYWGVPLGALLFLRLWDRPGLFARRGEPVASAGVSSADPSAASSPAAGARAWLGSTTLLTLACCVIVGSTGLYYAVFALLLLLGGSLLALMAGRGRGTALSGVLAAALIAATLAANLAPTLAYRSAHGTNVAIKRTTIEADQFGLRLTNLLLPVQEYRLAPLTDVNQRYTEATSTGYCESCFENLGAVGSVGFLWLALIALASIAGLAGASVVVPSRARLLSERVSAPYRPAALGVALSFALATVGGLSSLIAFAVTKDIRGWNRISLFIAFFSLLAVAMLLDAGWRAARRRIATRPAALACAGLALAGLLTLGILDETSSYFVPKYAKDARQWTSDAAFVRSIEARMPRGAAIFQLPYVPFPEGYGANGTSVSAPNPNFGTTYELARGPIHSEHLRWSYGAMKGRPADWQASLATQPLYLSLAAAAADGFDGLWVDPHGYSVATRPRLAPVLEALLGVPALHSPAHDLLFFDLRPFARRLARRHEAAQLQALRETTLYPLRTACGTDGIELANPSPAPRAATLRMRLYMHAQKPLPMLVHYPGDENEALKLGTTPVEAKRALSVPPGTSTIGFSLIGTPKPHAARLAGPVVEQPALTEPALAPFLKPPHGQPGARLKAGFSPPPCLQSVEAVKSLPE